VKRILIVSEKDKKEVCQCRSCNKVFNQNEVKRIHKEHLGQTLICPYCGSTSWGRIDQLNDEEYNTYKSKNFHKKEKKYKDNIRHYNVNDFLYEEEL
jgi:hypothetical protein